jgi:hypothetical protein
MLEIKPIFIIDCFVQSDTIQEKLDKRINEIKIRGGKVMLISNTPVPKETIEALDLYLYDKENRLFSDMPSDDIVLYKLFQEIEIYEFTPGVQRHGLSVLRNLGKAVRIAKAYGYTHFHRIEVDDMMGTESMNMMMSIPESVEELGKKGLLFFNETDVSFHYMYFSIDSFISDIPEIETQQDYTDYLKNQMNSDRYKNVEDFLRHTIDNKGTNIIREDGNNMQKYFIDTIWNTETSQSNLPSTHNGCTTGFYRTNRNGIDTGEFTILSYNYKDEKRERSMTIKDDSGNSLEISHTLYGKGYWQYNIVPNNAISMDVYENGELIYTDSTFGKKSYVVINQ